MSRALAGRRIGLLTAAASRLGGGVFEAVVAQVALLRGWGARPVVLALADRFSAADAGRLGACEVHHAAVLGPRRFGYAPQLHRLLSAARLDLLHLHGIWMYPSAAAAGWAAQSGRPLLISPHGMLDRWITGRGRLQKGLARIGYERRSWRRAARFHALTAAEAADIARETGRDDSLVIANPAPPAVPRPPGPRAPQVVYLGRFHPKKNLPALIAAWSELDRRGALPAAARLVLAGWGSARDSAALQRALAAAPPGIVLAGPQFGADKARLLGEARFVVLPSLSEGLPIAVLEAWSAGTPTLISQNCHLPQGFAAGAARDCGTSPAAIAACLERTLALDEPGWQAMSRAAVELARGPFGAATIAAQWHRAYAQLLAGAPGA